MNCSMPPIVAIPFGFKKLKWQYPVHLDHIHPFKKDEWEIMGYKNTRKEGHPLYIESVKPEVFKLAKFIQQRMLLTP